MSDNKKYYYYAICLIGVTNDGKKTSINGSSYVGLVNNYVTLKDLEDAKDFLGMEQTAAVISISYMGYMTADEMNG